MEPFIGEIRAFAFGFTPQGWAACNGQLLPIQQYSALFSILGVQYGGNGTTNFALPNFQGQIAIGTGQLPGGSTYTPGDTGGETGVVLNSTEIPSHTHTFNGGTAASPVTTLLTAPTPGNCYISNPFAKTNATTGVPGRSYGPSTPAPNVMLNPQAVSIAGSGQAHNNMQPYVTINYCIALEGTWPQRD